VTARSDTGPEEADTTADGSASTVALLRVDPRLRDAVPADERGFAERVVVVPRRTLDPGLWEPAALVDRSVRPFAALLLSGVVTQQIMLAGRCSANILGPGDLFRPWPSGDTVLPCGTRWTVNGGAEIAVLDERFVMSARKWPGLSTVVYERLAEQLEAAAVRAAIIALPRVEERVLALFWQLADRWGVVTGEGVVVRLPLTHAVIGHLVGAQRPTVSLALQALAEAGLMHRGAHGAWTLAADSRAMLAAPCERFDTSAAAGRLAPPQDADGRAPAPEQATG
jgi:CRP/FNR family transcriptional regulator, cyclic AMP receptor protein